MSNDKIAKDDVRGNISFKVDWDEFTVFEMLVYNADIMASIVSESILKLVEVVDTNKTYNKNDLQKNITQTVLLSSILEKQINETKNFLENRLKSS
jgi:hypothetical protein